jgi:hypothetical protein
MRYFILGTILLLSSCSVKKDTNEETMEVDSTSGTSHGKTSEASNDAIRDSISNETLDEIVHITYPLDSLLNFNSEAELKEIFGNEVKRSTGYYPEGMGEYQNTLLYPDSKNEVEFVWLDDSVNFNGLMHIKVSGQKTGWKTFEGITLGTTLKELESLNQRPFAFYGFGWDYSGMVDWGNGHLFERQIFVSLDYPGESIPPEFDGLLGDHKMKSDSELAQKANPVVREIEMMKLK